MDAKTHALIYCHSLCQTNYGIVTCETLIPESWCVISWHSSYDEAKNEMDSQIDQDKQANLDKNLLLMELDQYVQGS